MDGRRNDLDQCPHSEAIYSHRWHGLPVKGCGGSHLSIEEAKKMAKPFGANDEKYLLRSKSNQDPLISFRFLWDGTAIEDEY